MLPSTFDVFCGLETEHLISSRQPEGLTLDNKRAEMVAFAKAFVEAYNRRAPYTWCYDYPFELYNFPGTFNRVMPNGGRLYDEICYVETCTPECGSPIEIVAAEEDQRVLLEDHIRVFRESQSEQDFLIAKTNVDYGVALPYSASNACHENYCISPQLFAKLTSPSKASLGAWIPYLVSRSILTGAGCAYGRLPFELADSHEGDCTQTTEIARTLSERFSPDGVTFQLSQRADFFSTLYSLETMRFRPLVNLRDEPHGAPSRRRRLHVITGDSNRCEVANFLKVGISQLVLQMLEADFVTDDYELSDPLAAFRIVSRDLSFRSRISLASGGTTTALEIQGRLIKHAKLFLRLFRSSLPDHTAQVIDLWESTVSSIAANDLGALTGALDWASKLTLALEYQQHFAMNDLGRAVECVEAFYSVVGDPYFEHFRTNRMIRLIDSTGPSLQTPNTRAALRLWMINNLPVQKLTWDWVVLDDGETYYLPDPARAVALDRNGVRLTIANLSRKHFPSANSISFSRITRMVSQQWRRLRQKG